MLDAFKGNLTESDKKQIANLNSDLVTIPDGMTSQLQVLDVAVNTPFDHVKKAYMKWLISEDHVLTPMGKIKKPSVTILCEWIKCAWKEISKEPTQYGFQKCCISNMDGGEDDILCESTEHDNDTSEEESEDWLGRMESEAEGFWEVFFFNFIIFNV